MFAPTAIASLDRGSRSDMDRAARLRMALTAFEVYRTPRRIDRVLEAQGVDGLVTASLDLDPTQRRLIEDGIDALLQREIDVLVRWTTDYPRRLQAVAQAPPVLFFWGNKALLTKEGIGMCGARESSPAGLKA